MAKKEISRVNPSIKKLKLLVTIVDRSKALFYMDLIEQFEVNMQTVIYGKGTAGKEIFSFIREDKTKDILETISDKFEKVKNGKGIAYTIPLKSIIGVSIYQFLSNSQTFKKEAQVNE